MIIMIVIVIIINSNRNRDDNLRELPVYCRHPCDARVNAGVRPGCAVIAKSGKSREFCVSQNR